MRVRECARCRGDRIEVALEKRLVEFVAQCRGVVVGGGGGGTVVVGFSVVPVVAVVPVFAVVVLLSPAPSSSDLPSSTSTVCVIASVSDADAGFGCAGAIVSVVLLVVASSRPLHPPQIAANTARTTIAFFTNTSRDWDFLRDEGNDAISVQCPRNDAAPPHRRLRLGHRSTKIAQYRGLRPQSAAGRYVALALHRLWSVELSRRLSRVRLRQLSRLVR